jgi:hypothetical protein
MSFQIRTLAAAEMGTVHADSLRGGREVTDSLQDRGNSAAAMVAAWERHC